MNVRKPVDYSPMFTSLDTLMAANLPQIELYREIGQLVSGRLEKGAAVAAAEYLNNAYPDASGFSPRNLRRMREFYRTYENTPEVLAKAMTIGWTQNVVILEAELTGQEKEWYIQEVKQFGWSKLTLLEKIKSGAHTKGSLDFRDEVCYTEENNTDTESANDDKNPFYLPREYLQKSNGRVYNEGLGEKSSAGEQVSNRVCGNQYRGDWQSGLSSGPPQAGGTRDRLRRQNGPSVDEQRLRPVRPPDWDGPGQSAEYAPDLRRRPRWEAPLVDGLHGPPRRGSRPVVHR